MVDIFMAISQTYLMSYIEYQNKGGRLRWGGWVGFWDFFFVFKQANKQTEKHTAKQTNNKIHASIFLTIGSGSNTLFLYLFSESAKLYTGAQL